MLRNMQRTYGKPPHAVLNGLVHNDLLQSQVDFSILGVREKSKLDEVKNIEECLSSST